MKEIDKWMSMLLTMYSYKGLTKLITDICLYKDLTRTDVTEVMKI